MPEAAPQVCYRHADRRAGVRCQRCERPICPSCMSTASVGFHCPECAHGGRQKVYTAATLRRAATGRLVVTQSLIGVNVAVFIAGFTQLANDALAGRTGFIVDGGLFGPSVAAGEWWRIFTSGFLHGGLLHLGFNMYALWMLGAVLEPALGSYRYLAVYTTSLTAGSFGVLLLSPNALTVGASGAVFGLFGAMFFAQRSRGIDPFSTGLGSVLVINLVFTFAVPGISIGGHLGGLAGGALCGWLVFEVLPRARVTEPLQAAIVAGIGAALFAGCMLIV